MSFANTIKRLSSIEDVIAVEAALVRKYLSDSALNYSESVFLKQYLDQAEPSLRPVISLPMSLTLPDLEHYFELLIPTSDRQLNGAYFTPRYIVDFIVNRTDPRLDERIIDPSCGSGAFLLGALRHLHQKVDGDLKKIVNNCIYGADILSYNVRRSKLIIALYALQYGVVLEDEDMNIITCDSLSFRWNETYDVVIGNPPYVRFQDLSTSQREELPKTWDSIGKGAFNLYFAFFELGLNLLNSAGRLGYITPNNYFTSLAGESLRAYFQVHRCVHTIIDFSHKKVFKAQTYTALTFADKSTHDYVDFARIGSEDKPEQFLLNFELSPNALSQLHSKKWRLLHSADRENIQIIENIGMSIGKLFDINVGIATLKDSLYFVNSKVCKGRYLLKKI